MLETIVKSKEFVVRFTGV